MNSFAEFAAKMQAAATSRAAMRAFQHNYENLAAGKTGLIREDEIQPIAALPRLDDIAGKHPVPNRDLLNQTAILKLNGGLGTGMGLEKAKSLLVVKQGLTFLDFIARQILHLRQREPGLRFLLMNSCSTTGETIDFLKNYPELGDPKQLELLQSSVPKVDAVTLQPVRWPENPQLEWCPPGHGDLYPSLLATGWLDRFAKEGVKYLFVSNADNLGATLDLALLTHFAASEQSFLMEVAERTASDRKGGHLARRGDRLLLRESAQCREEDIASFQDIGRHRFFNTNNLWIRLDRVQALIEQHGGFLPLPMIKNLKTVDPRNRDSRPVIQLETAMGAAIECFADSGAIAMPRSRFSPVKTTSDLFALRSDAYDLTDDWRLVLNPERAGVPPTVELDGHHYKMVDQLEKSLCSGVPSLKHCRQLIVKGRVLFSSDNVFRGTVEVSNPGPEFKLLPAGTYDDETVCL